MRRLSIPVLPFPTVLGAYLHCSFCVASALMLATTAAVSAQGPAERTPIVVDSEDFYWADGRKVSLLRVAGELVVRLAPSTDPEAFVEEVTDGQGVLAGFKPSVMLDETTLGFQGPSEKDPLDAIFDRLRKVAGVVWVAPVFYDNHSRTRLWVTDQIVVALRRGVDPHEIFGSDFVGYRRLEGTPDQYVATLAVGGGRSTLDAANELNSRPEVLWASPNFFQSFRTWTRE